MSHSLNTLSLTHCCLQEDCGRTELENRQRVDTSVIDDLLNQLVHQIGLALGVDVTGLVDAGVFDSSDESDESGDESPFYEPDWSGLHDED